MADSLIRLRIDSQEFDSKLKIASQSLTSYLNKLKDTEFRFKYLDDGVMDCVKAMGKLSTQSTSAKQSLSEMTKAFTDLSMTYRQFTEAEKATPLGQEMKKSLDSLKSRIMDSKKALAEIQGELNGSKFGQFGGVIDTIGHKLGLTANATELLTSETALMTAGIGASVAVIGKATDALVSYNNELAKQDQITQVTTGLKGEDADRMTDKMRALSDTYKVDFREAVNAANTLMTQFGKTGDEATQLIKDGMQGMIQGDGPKLLSMIQQYAPAFRDAGVSASQLVAVIQNSEGGIFTDQNMNAIVMGIKNIRLMTKQTSDALAKLGIDGQEMSRKLNDGSITVFDALKQVASQLKTVDSNSQAAGEVMQAVFGRQGVTAGTNIAKAIETLNTNLEETKKQTGEVGDAFAELQTANEKLNKAIRDCFEYDGWEQMATGIKAKLVTALADVLDKLGEIKKWFAETAPDWLKEKPQPVNNTKVDTDYISRGTTKQERQERYTRVTTNIQKKLNNLDTQEANLGKPYSYIDKNGGLVEQIDTPEQIAQKRRQITASRQQLNKRLQVIQAQESTLVVEPPKTKTKVDPIIPPGTTHKTTPAEQADAKYDQAQKDYNQALEQAAMEVKAGTITSAEGKKKELQATETLWKAIGDAREIYDSPKLQEEQKKVEAAYTELAGETSAAIEAQKAAEKAARELEQAQKRLADAQNELAEAQATGDLKKIYAAEKKVETAQVQVDARTGSGAGEAIAVPITISNLDALKQHLTEEMATTPVGDSLLQNMQEAFSDASAIGAIFSTAVKNGIDTSQFDTSGIMQKLLNHEDIDDTVIQDYVEQLNALLKEKFDETEWPKVLITFDVKSKEIQNLAKNQQDEAKKMAQSWQAAGSAIQQVGNAMNAIQDPAAKVMGTIAQAIGAVALGAANALASSKEHPETQGWAWIAYAASVAATMVSTIATIHSATGYAEGGIVKGNSYSGDNIGGLVDGSQFVGLNAGELVLNKSQQASLAEQLERGESGGVETQPYVTGEMIYLGMNNYLKGAGYGELVTTRR